MVYIATIYYINHYGVPGFHKSGTGAEGADFLVVEHGRAANSATRSQHSLGYRITNIQLF